MAHSEDQLQAKLYGPGTAELVEGVEPAISKLAPSQTPSQHLHRLAELGVKRPRTTEVSNRWSKVGMIQYIEHLSSELQFQ